MSYTRPSPTAVNVSWVGEVALTRPAPTAVNTLFPQTAVTGVGAVTLSITAAAAASHGVSGAGAATLDIVAAAEGEYQSITVTGVGAATLDISAAATAFHGISGAGAATLDIGSAAAVAHGIAGATQATLSITAAATGAVGISGAGAATLTFAAAAVASHPRYEVRGLTKQSGVLVNRRVRVYLRSTGALVGEVDTTAGAFTVHTGFAEAEHYLVPIDLDEDATDWLPPTANRVLSVLAQDA